MLYPTCPGKRPKPLTRVRSVSFRHDQVAAAAFEARPVALRFNTDYPVRHLVTIADLAADRGASGVRSTLVRERRIYRNAAVAEKIPLSRLEPPPALKPI